MAPPPLPEELLVRICSYLCFHCQNPDDFPNTDEPCVRESKATLARLCRASKQMLAVGQPILYHYYATGNILGPIQPMISDYPAADDKLPAFLCTLIRHPFLATHIRSLQLQEMQSTHLPAFAPELLPLLNSASRTHGIRPPTSLQWVIDPSLPRPKDASDKKTRVAIHLWLRELAIILTPRTEKLMYGHNPFSPPTHIEASDRVLPALRSLTCRNGVNGYSLSMTQLLLRMAPNLVSLHTIDICGSYGDGVVDNVPPVLPQVRKLVAEGLMMNTFDTMVMWCGGVRDVEYYYHTTFYGGEILQALVPIRGVLRRFCFMFTPGRLASCSDIGAPYERLLPKNRSQTIESLQKFCQLEELVIDQWAFYSDEYGFGDTKRLITLLPASIQSVHFRYVYKSMQAELLKLALAVPDSFPKLRRLRVDIAENCRPERQQGLEQMRSVGPDFADVGVQVEWGVDRSYSRSSIVIPEGIVSPVSAPVVSPPADSSSLIEAENPTTRRGWRGVTPRFRKGISSFRSNYLPG